MHDSPDFMTPAEVMDYLGVSRQTLDRWRREQFGPASFLLTPRKRYYRRSEVDAWLAQRERDTSTAGRLIAA
ncbi:MAG: helix-turn-helix transcriptional regulator [Streptosporangiaceae bacterium]